MTCHSLSNLKPQAWHFLFFLMGIASVACISFAQKPKPRSSRLPSPQPNYRIVTRNESKNGKSVTIVMLERMSIMAPDIGEPLGFSSMFAYDKKPQETLAADVS